MKNKTLPEKKRTIRHWPTYTAVSFLMSVGFFDRTRAMPLFFCFVFLREIRSEKKERDGGTKDGETVHEGL